MSEEAKATAAPAAGEGGESIPDMSLLSITDGENERGIPVVKFIDDVGAFADSFTPPASAELLIGAYTELHSKFKTYEISLTQKREYCDRNAVSLLYFMLNFALFVYSVRGQLETKDTRNGNILEISQESAKET